MAALRYPLLPVSEPLVYVFGVKSLEGASYIFVSCYRAEGLGRLVMAVP